MRFEKASQSFLERAATLHWRPARHEEYDVFRHEAKDRIDVTGSGCSMPLRDEFSDRVFVCVHQAFPWRIVTFLDLLSDANAF